jgi:hypothetical protein
MKVIGLPHTPAALPLISKPQFPLIMMLGCSQAPSGGFGEEINY